VNCVKIVKPISHADQPVRYFALRSQSYIYSRILRTLSSPFTSFIDRARGHEASKGWRDLCTLSLTLAWLQHAVQVALMILLCISIACRFLLGAMSVYVASSDSALHSRELACKAVENETLAST
jgi:hypothetical protein